MDLLLKTSIETYKLKNPFTLYHQIFRVWGRVYVFRPIFAPFTTLSVCTGKKRKMADSFVDFHVWLPLFVHTQKSTFRGN